MVRKKLGVSFITGNLSKIINGVRGVRQLTPVKITLKACFCRLSSLLLAPLTPISLCMGVRFKNKH